MADLPMGDLVFVIVVGAVAASVGAALGIFLLAPRLARGLDREDDRPRTDDGEPGDRPD